MEIFFGKNQIILNNINNFNLHETFNCGQCFRWTEISKDNFIGVVFDQVIQISQEKNSIILSGKKLNKMNYESIWKKYFDLDTNYIKIKNSISKIDRMLQTICNFAPGIHILRQNPWETLCSFIISQNNNIPRIKGIISELCRHFGKEIEPNFFTFPSSCVISQLKKTDLNCLKCGFRDNYILDAAKKVSSGEVNFEKIKILPLLDAKKELMKIKGVGPKIADCTLLFGFHRLNAFPVDTWMKRALKKFFPNKDTGYFGPYAGVAQQYIFHFCRMNPDLIK